MARRRRTLRQRVIDAERREEKLAAADHYVYRARSATGETLYVGRSIDPVTRMRAHHSHPPAPWATEAVELSAWGPFSYADALRYERELIVAERPRGNSMFIRTHTGRGYSIA